MTFIGDSNFLWIPIHATKSEFKERAEKKHFEIEKYSKKTNEIESKPKPQSFLQILNTPSTLNTEHWALNTSEQWNLIAGNFFSVLYFFLFNLDSPSKYGSYNHRRSVFPVYKMTLLVCFLFLLLPTFIHVIFYSVELLNCLRIRGQKRTWLNALKRGKKNVFEWKKNKKTQFK